MADRWAARTWRSFGSTDPYYAVCTDEQYRADRLDADARSAFFRSGEEHIEWVLAAIRRHVSPAFSPSRTLDFGCGVGRLVFPLARLGGHVVGADVSPEMLSEAERNATELGITNVSFAQVDDSLSSVPGPYDFVHAFITLQHIPPKRGRLIASRLVGRLAPGGVAALHFTYRRNGPLTRKIVHELRKYVPGVNGIVNLVQGRPFSVPLIPMFYYRLDRLVEDFRRLGCSEIHMLLTDHGGHCGAMMLLQVG